MTLKGQLSLPRTVCHLCP